MLDKMLSKQIPLFVDLSGFMLKAPQVLPDMVF
jgi:hypothetical protein